MQNCKSNVAVESHFKGVEHGRLGGHLRVRPRQFILQELKYVLGKLNESKIGKGQVRRTFRKEQELQNKTEQWNRRRKATNFADSASAAKILKRCLKFDRKMTTTTTNSNTTIPCEGKSDTSTTDAQQAEAKVENLASTSAGECQSMETQVCMTYKAPVVTSRSWKTCRLDDTDIERALEILRMRHPDIAGLQHPGNGACIRNKSMPRFTAVNKPFVQILHIPDHWICVTNIFSSDPQNVWLFDSLHPARVPAAVTVQLTSLLQLVESPDTISVYIRNCPRQPLGTTLCGFYAIAAAAALCKRQDPTLLKFSPYEMVTGI